MSEKLINLDIYPIRENLECLLTDRTTGKNILLATDSYQKHSHEQALDIQLLQEIDIKPRILKSLEDQKSRSKKKAEVYTPAWVICEMLNMIDREWFGYDAFNTMSDKAWTVRGDRITSPAGKSWKDYITSTRLEITCGEAPFIVSRYDAASGERIEIKDRIGMLDRKLRIVNENALCLEDWLYWQAEALKSIYGYEWQGDSLLIGRTNILMTMYEYFIDTFGTSYIPDGFFNECARIISWNIFQADGLTGKILYGETECLIYDWASGKVITFNSLKGSSG